MEPTTPRQPPRFVPTLTEVVGGPSAPVPAAVAAPVPQEDPPALEDDVAPYDDIVLQFDPFENAGADALHPRTAQAVVAKQATPPVAPPAVATPTPAPQASLSGGRIFPPVAPPPAMWTQADRVAFEERIVSQLLQQVVVQLDLRVREAVANVIKAQTRALLPQLQEEVESVVRQTVMEAVGETLAHMSPGSAASEARRRPGPR